LERAPAWQVEMQVRMRTISLWQIPTTHAPSHSFRDVFTTFVCVHANAGNLESN